MKNSRPVLCILIALMLAVFGVGGTLRLAPVIVYADNNVISEVDDVDAMESALSEDENNEPTGEVISVANSIEQDESVAAEGISDESVSEVIESGECGQDGDNVQWTKESIDGEIVLTISGQGKMRDYATFYDSGYGVSSLPWGTDINKVVVEKGITRIGTGSFYNCNKLKEVETSDGLLEIGDLAFQECPSLETISIPASVNYLGRRQTGGSIEGGMLSGGNQIKLYYGGTLDEFLHISNNGFSLGDLYIDSKIVTTINLPEKTTRIDDYAFYGLTSLKSISIPEGVLTIGDYAFDGCKRLTEVSIPDSVTNVGEYAFYLCNSLSTVRLPNNLSRIEEGTFQYCLKLVELDIPESISYVGGFAFTRCPAVLNFSGEVALQQYSFCFTYLDYIKVAEGTTVLPRSSFSGWGYGNGYGYLKRIDLPESLETIDEKAFIDSSLGTEGEQLVLPNQLKTINTDAFSVNNCYYDKIVIPESVEYIGDSAFNSKTIIELRCPPPTVYTTGLKSCATIYYSCSLWDETDRYNWSPDANWIPVHSYGDWKTTKEPTYTATGSKEHICEICGYVETVDIPTLEKVAINKTAIFGIAEKTYTGKAITQFPVVLFGDTTLECDTDYTLSYKNNTNVGTATMTITGKGNYTGTVTKTFKITPKRITPKVATSYTATTWDGKDRSPTVTVYDGSKKLTKGKDYKISMASSRKNVGKYTITVKPVSGGNYTFNDAKTTFKINPKGTALKKVEPQSKAFKVTWNKQATKMSSSKITGYQIQWSTSSTFAKNNHTKMVKGDSTTSYTINSKVWSSIKGSKKYYVRIRTYKTTGSGTYYSGWSSKMTVTTKR